MDSWTSGLTGTYENLELYYNWGIRVMHSITKFGLYVANYSSLDIFTTSVGLMTGLSVGRLGKGRTSVAK